MKLVSLTVFINVLLIPSFCFGQSSSLFSPTKTSTERIRQEFDTDKGCKYVEYTDPNNVNARRDMKISWSGECTNGFVSGDGILVIKTSNGAIQTEKVNFLNGLEDGEGEWILNWGGATRTFVGRWEKGYRVSGTLEIKSVNGSVITKYTGGFKNQNYDGYGELTNLNGDEYVGVFVNGRYSGKGRLKEFSGDVYEGDFLNNRPNGKGKYIYEKGNWKSSEGNFVDGYLDGNGKQLFVNGDVAEGEFKKGRLNGSGLYKYHSGQIDKGIFKDGLLDGFGKRTMPSGEAVQGNFSKGSPFGMVTKTDAKGARSTVKIIDKHIQTFSNGDTYDGEWVGGEMHGNGKLTYSNGTVYIGEFKESKFNGKGRLTENTGHIQDGIFENNSLVQGKIIYEAGGFDEGSFIKTKLTGRGLRMLPNGDSIKAIFVSGIPTGSGSMIYKNGDILNINFDDLGKPDGSGSLIKKNGEKISVTYQHGYAVPAIDTRKDSAGNQSNLDNSLLNFDDAKKKCTDIGFKAGTEKFGQCVLKLTK